MLAYIPHLSGGQKTNAQHGQLTCGRPHDWLQAKKGLNYRSPQLLYGLHHQFLLKDLI